MLYLRSRAALEFSLSELDLDTIDAIDAINEEDENEDERDLNVGSVQIACEFVGSGHSPSIHIAASQLLDSLI